MAAVFVPVVVGAEELLLGLLAAVGIMAAAKNIPKATTRTTEKCDEPDHRGRIQAQGDGLEDSEAWAQASPPTKAQGLSQLNGLYFRLSSSEQKSRAIPYSQIQQKINSGPISAGYIKSFYAPPNLQSKRGDTRMDLEVRKGLAFV